MNNEYYDIRSRIAEEPKWWDEYAVPRYEPFSPYLAKTNADECALLLVQCARCGRDFNVAMSISSSDILKNSYDAHFMGLALALRDGDRRRVEQLLAEGCHVPYEPRPWLDRQRLFYGDPPNIWCCKEGPGVYSKSRRVLEFWELALKPVARRREWVRRPEYEVELAPEYNCNHD